MYNFLTKEEYLFSKKCEEKNIKYEYESKIFEILKPFQDDFRLHQGAKYKPDFICVTPSGKTIIVEVKGYKYNRDFYYKYISYWMKENNYSYMVIKYVKSRNDFYFYHRNIRKRKLLTKDRAKTIWEYFK